jgi:hypothetical protein
VVSLCIIVATAATLNANGVTDIQTSAQAAEALRPIARPSPSPCSQWHYQHRLAFSPCARHLWRLCAWEALGWTTGLDRKPLDAKAFYVTIARLFLPKYSPDLNPMK